MAADTHQTTPDGWVPIPYRPGEPQPRIADGIYRGIRSDGRGGFEGLPITPQTTVRVRIPVIVDMQGRWVSSGCSGDDPGDASAAYSLASDLLPGERVSWIEADVPLPQEVTVLGEVAG